jgi:hypothetical protein
MPIGHDNQSIYWNNESKRISVLFSGNQLVEFKYDFVKH